MSVTRGDIVVMLAWTSCYTGDTERWLTDRVESLSKENYRISEKKKLLFRLSYCTGGNVFSVWGIPRETCKIIQIYNILWGTAVAQWLRSCATNRKVAGSIPSGVSGVFIDIKSFRSHYGPGVDTASNRNE